uniref:Sialic acid binding Ig like lectin 1 n=1 Tax=Ornithorhynchus anatinus TaxID=9258 RepID=A0A6I8N752_ORNAN
MAKAERCKLQSIEKQPPGFTDLTSPLSLSASSFLNVSRSPDLGSWGVTCPRQLQAVQGSCLVIPCSFTFPSNINIPDSGITLIWYHGYTSANPLVVYHSTQPELVDGRFRGRAFLQGDVKKQTCTLLLRDLTPADDGLYNFRFEISEGNRWSDMQGSAVTVTEHPDPPVIASMTELREDTKTIFNCSTKYGCPEGIVLSWQGQDPARSETVQLEKDGISQGLSLQVDLSWKDHGRRLTCHLSVGQQQVQGEITLKVKYAPKKVSVTIDPSRRNIHLGDLVSLTCAVSSSQPDATVFRWFKDGAPYPGTRSVLSLPSASRKDYGLYYCEAENPMGKGVAAPVTLYIFSAEIQVSPANEIREGQRVTLTCSVPEAARQEIHYAWYKNNIWIKEGTAQTLTFHEASSADTGFYFCKVQNDKGREQSPPISLLVTYPPRMPVLTSFLETQQGRLAIIHCTVDSQPPAALTLQRDGHVMATTSSYAAPSQRLSITSTRNSLRLEIRGLEAEDGGEYCCVATNSLGNASTAYHFRANTARVLIYPALEVQEGQEVTLSCIATQSIQPDVRYTWYRNGVPLQDRTDSTTVTFQSVTSANAGAYHCRVWDSQGTDSTSPAVPLTVLYSPRQPLLTFFLEAEIRSVLLLCTVDSLPEAELTLLRWDRPVASSAQCGGCCSRICATASPNALRLEIRDVVLEDEGNYTCMASNSYGNATASVTFTAQTVWLVISPSATLMEGQEANLSCQVHRAAGATPTNFTWYRNGAPWARGLEDVMSLGPVVGTDSALYACSIDSEAGSRRSNPLALHVLYPPKPPHFIAFLDTAEGRMAVFFCSVDSSPPAELTLAHGEKLLTSSSQARTSGAGRLRAQASPNTLRVELGELGLGDAGTYHCTASNALGTASSALLFHVHAALVIVSPPAEIQEGMSVSLTCQVVGQPPEEAVYHWFKNSQPLLEASDPVLSFPAISAADSGSYHCQAQVPGGASRLSPSASLHVSYPPRQLKLTTLLEAEAGRLGLLFCTVDSDPEAVLTLQRGDQLVASSLLKGGGPGLSTQGGSRIHSTWSPNSLRVEILDLVLEDEGNYTCVASNLYGNATASVNFIAQTVFVQIFPSPDVHEGQAVNLTCIIAGGSYWAVNYTWYRGGIWHSEGPRASSLLLPNVTRDDAAPYSCSVSTPRGPRFSPPSMLTIMYPPRAMRLTSFLEIHDGQLAVLSCTVDSLPQSELVLTRAGVLLAASSQGGEPIPRIHTSSSHNALRLEVQILQPEDEGLYVCSASNGLGQTNASTELQVEATRVAISPSPEVLEGTSVTLTCEDVTPVHPSTVYTWYHNAHWLQEGPASSLLLRRTTRAQAGAYSCTVHDVRGSRGARPAALRILYAPRDVALAFFLETRMEQVTVIQCTVDSEPQAELTLYRDREPVASSHGTPGEQEGRGHIFYTHNALRLELLDVRLEDMGPYICLARNAYGTANSSGHLLQEGVRVQMEPTGDICEGDLVKLSCLLVHPTLDKVANYTWFWNGRWLREGPEPGLTFPRVSRTHAGAYHCQAEGSAGRTTSRPVNLHVLYAPQTPTVTSFLDPESGQRGILHCSTDSEPQADLTLYCRGQPVASTHQSTLPAPRVQVFPSHNALRVEVWDMRPGDQGEYVCSAINALGTANASTYFGVRGEETGQCAGEGAGIWKLWLGTTGSV